MKCISEYARLILVPVIIVLCFAVENLNAQSVQSPCGCGDVDDLLNLLNRDNAVIAGLDEYKQKFLRPTDRVNEILPEPNPSRLTKGDKVRAIINQQANWVKDPAAKSASGEIDSTTCEGKVEAGTECLRHILKERTDRNSNLCRGYKREYKIGENEDVMNFLPVYQYIAWQLDLYDREVKTILRILNGISSVCRPKDWFGIITIYEDITNISSVNTERAEDNTIRAGTIRFKGKAVAQQLSSWQITGKYVNTKFAKEGKRDCTGGLATAKPDTEYKTSFTMEVSKTGGGPFPMTVDIGDPDEKNKAFIGLRIPNMVVKWDFSSVSKRESGCPNDSLKETFLYTTDYPLNSEPLNFLAQFSFGKTRLEPSQTISGIGPVENSFLESGGSKQSHTHWVTVYLYKLEK